MAGYMDRKYRNDNRYEKHVRPAKCDVRLDIEEDKMLNELSERNGVTRSEIMRKALRDFARWNNENAVDVLKEEELE